MSEPEAPDALGTGGRIPLVIDTDPGIDDAAALALALFSPAVDVRLIATVAGNVGIQKTTRNALRLESFMGTRVPVARGAAHPLGSRVIEAEEVHGQSGLGGWDYEDEAADLLLDNPAGVAIWDELLASEACGTKATILTLGPLTNIALLLREHPDLPEHVERVICMGGAIHRGNVGPLSEFNIAADALAAGLVVRSGLDLTFVPLEIADSALLTAADQEVLAAASSTGAAVAQMMGEYHSSFAFVEGKEVYDPTAFACLVAPELFCVERCFLEVEGDPTADMGATYFDIDGLRDQRPNVRVATGIDAAGFKRWFLDGFRRCP